MLKRTILNSAVILGVRAQGAEEANRLLLALLAQYTDAPVQADGTDRRIRIRAPHQVAVSPLLAGLALIAAAQAPQQRQEARLEGTRNIVCGYQEVARKLTLSLCAVLTSAAKGLRCTVGAEGLTIRLGRFTLPHQNLILSEIYHCLKPAEAPRFWWYEPDRPGKYAVAGYEAIDLTADQEEKAAVVAREMGCEPRLLRPDGAGVFLGTQQLRRPAQAAALIASIIVIQGMGELDQQTHRLRLFGRAHLSREAVKGLVDISAEAARLYDELTTHHQAAFMRQEGDETVILPDRLYALKQSGDLQRRYRRDASWLIPMVLAMVYHSLRKPEDPVAIFFEDFIGYLRVRVGWPNTETFKSLQERLDRWAAIAGTTDIHLLYQG